MIAFSNTGTGFKGAISYVLKEHEKYLPFEKMPNLIEQNNIWGSSSGQLAKQMRFIADSNSKSSRPVLHIAFSFHKDEKLPLEKSLEAMHLVLSEINFDKEKNQYILVKHNDTDVEHYHWVINKVDLDSRNLDTSYIKNRLQVACDKVEKKLSLRYTKGRTIIYDPQSQKGYSFTKKEHSKKKIFHDKSDNISDTKQFIFDELQRVLSSILNLKNLEGELLKKGIECKTTFNKNGLSGISFCYNDQAYKGSQIGCKAKDILNVIQQNKITNFKYQIAQLNGFSSKINFSIKDIVKDYENGNLYPDFKKHFKANQIDYQDDALFYKGYGISNKQVENFRKASETCFSAFVNEYEFKNHQYNELMKQKPEDVPVLFGRNKIIEENNALLFEQRIAIKPQLKIQINITTIPDFAGSFLKRVQECKKQLAELTKKEEQFLKININEKHNNGRDVKTRIRR